MRHSVYALFIVNNCKYNFLKIARFASPCTPLANCMKATGSANSNIDNSVHSDSKIHDFNQTINYDVAVISKQSHFVVALLTIALAARVFAQ